jgi:hypothetical protein
MRHRLRSLLKVPRWILVVALVLVMVRAFLPGICLHFINQALGEKLGQYQGHVMDFDLTLYRGAYQLQGLEIVKKNSDLPAILSIDQIDLSLAWRALLRKELSGDIKIDQATVRLADSENKKKKQFGTEEKGSNWQSVFDLLVPISIESLKIHNSNVYFTNHDLGVDVPVKLEKIEFSAEDIRTRAKEMESPFNFSANLQGMSKLSAKGAADVLSSPMRGDVDFQLRHFDLKSVNRVSRHYIPLDISKGQLDVFGEAAMAKGRAKGYVKFFFKDGDIIARKQEFLSIQHFGIEIASAIGNWILKNNDSKKVAAVIPFEYDHGKLDIETSDAFWSAVKNSYDEIKPQIENSINLRSVVH